MSRERHKGKQLQGTPYGGYKKRSALAWMLCGALVFGGIWVPETGMSVQAAEAAKVSVQSEEVKEMTAQTEELMEVSVEMDEEDSIEEDYSLEEKDSSEEYTSSWDAEDGLAGDSVSGNAVMALSLDGAEDDIASGTYENIAWRIDANGKLTVEGTGEFTASTGGG